jgi:hypothetical protein
MSVSWKALFCRAFMVPERVDFSVCCSVYCFVYSGAFRVYNPRTS